MKPWLQYLIAFLVFCHGFIYVRVGAMLPEPVKGWKESSWLLGKCVSSHHLTTLVVSLHVIAGVVTLACALVIGWPSLLPGWWRPLAVVGGTAGIAAFAVFWDGQTTLLIEEGAIGAIISLVLLVGAIAVHAGQ
jgi:hypothetical protein